MINQSGSAVEVRAARNDGGQLDSAGEAILRLLHKAAGAAEAHSRQALETAQKLSSQLRAAEDRIAELEAEVQQYRERAERAEKWLRKISIKNERRRQNLSRRKSTSDSSQWCCLNRFPDIKRRDHRLAQTPA